MKPRSRHIQQALRTICIGSITAVPLLAQGADLIITEVNSNSNGGDYFELYNSGVSSINLDGWKWDDDSATPSAGATFGSVTIAPGAVLLVGAFPASEIPAFKTAWGLGDEIAVYANGGPGLGGNDAVVLFDSAGTVQASFNYKSSAITSPVTIAPFARPGSALPLGGHAGPSAGASLGNSVSAVWDGNSTSSPVYIAANIGNLEARSQTASIASIGSPGTNGLFSINIAPPAPPTISVDTNQVPAGQLRMSKISSLPLFGAEISAFDPVSKRLFVTSSVGLQIIDSSNPALPRLISIVDFTAPAIGLNSTDITSVAVSNGKVAVAVPNALATGKGHVVFLNAADASFISKVEVGVLPDSILFTPDGTKVLTPDEGQMLSDGTDPTLGSVTIIDVTDMANPSATLVDFTAFDGQAAALKSAGVRIFESSPGVLKLPSLDFEPEYIAVSPDSSQAMVTLQEANAVAILDIANATFTSIVPLGEKDYSALFADFSDQDGGVNLATGKPVFGMYMPDAIASFSAAGQTYYVTANEGDDRNDFMSETTTVGNAAYVLDPLAFPDAASLKLNANLGRLVVSNVPGLRGDSDGDGDIDRILSYGGRSISILDSSGNRIYDSGDLIDTTVAALGTPWFDDGRSDAKSCEPEGVSIGQVNGRTYAFVALERARSVMAFDVTDPGAVHYAGIVGTATDANPEAITFISAENSPNHQAMIAVTNETSNTLTFYSVAPYTLQLLHFADAEAGLLASQTAPNLAALVDAFDGTNANTLILAGGDNFIPSPFLNAGTDPALNSVSAVGKTAFARPDLAIHNEIGVEASAIGNHEWDLGSAVFADAIRNDGAWSGAKFPHITANLDFSGDSALSTRFTEVALDGPVTQIPNASTQHGKIVPSAVIVKGGQKIGLVGVTTQLIKSISSPSGTEVKGFPGGTGANGETDDMDLLASQVQPYIDELTAEGVNKIILLSHLQQITNEQSLASKLRGVDIILAAGSNTRLGDADDLAVEFPGHAADFANTYPLVTSGLDQVPTLIVNTDNEFTYLGRLIVDFDAFGQVIVPALSGRISENGAYATTSANVAAAWGVHESELATSAFASGTKGAKVKAITDAVQGVINIKDGIVYGYTEVYLEGERAFVRSEETNFGSISADANSAALRAIIGGNSPIVSLKNGGGIRAQIGAISSAGGSSEKLPPTANPSVGKLAGGVSLLDVENALRFNNKLMTFQTTPTGLKALLEHGVASWPNQGRFPQVGGVSFSWDPGLPAGNRITSMTLLNESGASVAVICQNGEVLDNAPASIQIVTLNFLANDGDGYPAKANGDQFRYLLGDGSLGPILADETLSFTASPQLPVNALGEISAIANYLSTKHGTPENAYSVADTTAINDLRIQNLSIRADSVIELTESEIWRLNSFTSTLSALGIDPTLVNTDPSLASTIDGVRSTGRNDVVSAPGLYDLYNETSIQDLRGSGNLLVQAQGETVTLTLPLQQSSSLTTWEPAQSNMSVTLPKTADKQFYRLALPNP
jgi:2',3'-cyclic-nucleotide 2'-phosphodiesterase (5'-nucleotidase family)